MDEKCRHPTAIGFHTNIEIGKPAVESEKKSDNLFLRRGDETSARIKIGIEDDLPAERVEGDFILREAEIPERKNGALILRQIVTD